MGSVSAALANNKGERFGRHWLGLIIIIQFICIAPESIVLLSGASHNVQIVAKIGIAMGKRRNWLLAHLSRTG